MTTVETPTFSIYKPGTCDKVESLIHCHIENTVFNRNDLPAVICAKDGLVYTAVYDGRMPEGTENIPVIISFQAHTFGKFAIIRVQKRK